MAISYTVTVIHQKDSDTAEYHITNGAGSKAVFPGIEGTFSLNEVFFNRKVYSPNELLADVLVNSSPSAAKIRENFEDKEVRFTIKDGDKKQSQVFSGLYIQEVMVLRVGASSTYLRLRIYSLDYQLTTQKYCRTYVAKRLGRDVLMEGCGAKKVGEVKISSYWINTQLAKLHPITLDVADEKGKNGDDVGMTSYLQYLKWNDNSATNEIILPYLVQYNESFYDFVSRTANRCGEFLYFEEGKLHLGLHTTSTNLEKEIRNADCNEVFGNQSTYVEQDYLSRDEVSEDWKNDDDGTGWVINWKEFEDDIDKKYAIAKSTDTQKYDFEVNEEPYHNRLFKEKFSSLMIMKNLLGGTFWWGVFAKMLKENTLYNILKGVIASVSKEVYEAKMASTDMQTLWKKKVYDEQKHINQALQKEGEGEKESITPFVAQGHLMNHEDYHQIRNGEQKVSAKIVTFNLGSNIKFFQVGQTLKYDGEEYIVIQVKLKPRLGQPRFNTIDADCKEETASMSSSFMQVKAVPVLKKDEKDKTGAIYPPMHPKGHILHAEPQVAFVTDHGYMDPLQQGRVRIRYPWEMANSTPSPWLRIVVPAATPGSGFYAEPNVGDEVLVCYEAGNMERPYVGGFLRNRDRNHVFVRGDMYMISKNGHGIGFNDPVDPTLFFQGLSPTLKSVKTIAAPLSMAGVKVLDGIPVLGNGVESDKQILLNLTGGTTLRDAYGLYSISMSTDQRKVDINSPFGTVSVNAFTGITISAPNGDISIKGKNVTIEAGNQLKMVSGLNIDTGHKDVFMKKGGTLMPLTMVGEILTDFVKEAVQVIDLKLLRCVMEIILRPVNGTTQIKSYNHLVLEAGPGTASLPLDKYKDGTAIKKQLTEKTDNNRRRQAAIEGLIDKIEHRSDAIVDEIDIPLEQFRSTVKAFNTCIALGKKGEVFEGNPPTAKSILEAVWDKDNQEQRGFVYAKGAEGTRYADLHLKEQIPEGQAHRVRRVVQYAKALSERGDDMYRLLRAQLHIAGLNEDENDAATKFYPQLKAALEHVLTDLLKFDKKVAWTNIERVNALMPQTEPAMKTLLKRLVFAKTLAAITDEDLCPITSDVTLSDDASNWAEYWASIRFKHVAPVGNRPVGLSDVKKALVDSLAQPFKEYKGIFSSSDRNVWTSNKEGQIVFSDQDGYSCYFDKDGSFHKFMTATTFDISTIKQELNNF